MPAEAAETAGVMTAGLWIALAALLIFGYSVFGRRLGRWSLTAPIVFMASGWVISRLFDATPGEVSGLEQLAEATLAIVLFADAAGVRPRQIEGDRGPMSRLLLIGLPLSIALGTLLAVGLWPSMPFYAALLLGAMLAPTDAALGAATVLNKAVPVRIRRVLNVESGLNDGLATPVVLFAIAALAGEEGLAAGSSAVSALLEIAVGAAVGAGVGYGAGRTVRWCRSRRLATARGLMVAVMMLPLFAYTFAGALDGNGFIAAFIAGTFFAAAWRPDSQGPGQTLELAESIIEPMGDATWLIFGLLAVPLLIVDLGWREVVFAVCALTVLRMVPVALSLLGTGLRPQTVLFIGWFGPRGLASVVFSLIALESLDMDPVLADVLATAALTITLSVVLHGVTAGAWARRYGAWVRETKPSAELSDGDAEPHSRGRMGVPGSG